MRLSRKSDYALRAIFMLVDHRGRGPLSIRQLAEANRIPKPFLEHILLEMKARGWVESLPGKRGGYLLARDPAEITMGMIVRHFDGILAPIDCVSVAAYRRCSQESVCRFRRVLLEVRNAVASMMDQASLEVVHQRALVSHREVFSEGFVGGGGI
ncbi:MAG: Rrf2 family transcriptional regulator [Leptospirales bacterium]|nr:Rrf2 family transcriptional regulator [Leptospirales bacterium]